MYLIFTLLIAMSLMLLCCLAAIVMIGTAKIICDTIKQHWHLGKHNNKLGEEEQL